MADTASSHQFEKTHELDFKKVEVYGVPGFDTLVTMTGLVNVKRNSTKS